MSIGINGIIRSAVIGMAAYGVVKTAEFVGMCKGIVYGCRAAVNNPEYAQKTAAEWDELDAKWKEFKDSIKA